MMQTIDSTFAAATVDDIKNMIMDETDCERDSLVEFILFPDELIQEGLEELLETLNFHEQDIDALKKHFSSKKIKSVIHFPNHPESILFEMSHQEVERFISRLNITRNPSKEIEDAAEKNIPEKIRNRIKVKLRNDYIKITREKSSFLCRVFRKLDTGSNQFSETFDFILSLLDELPAKADIFKSLEQKKYHYIQIFHKAEKIENELKAGNMETLVLSGMRIPSINKEDLLKKINMIDKIIYQME